VHLTPRRRAVVVMLLSPALTWFYLDWALYTGRHMWYWYGGSTILCDGSWKSATNGCSRYSITLAWFELIAATALFVALVWLLARWIVQPLRDMAGSVERFGPNSLGLRLTAGGPRDESRRLAEAIDAMLDRLADGYEAQRRFASTASHELRTPLATQRALIEVSLTSALTEEQLELLSRQLLATNERNERLVDGLLTLAETERGTVATSALRLDRVVADVVELHRAAAKERDVELSAVLAPLTVVGEHPLLDRLAGNLISNAIKYNHPGGTVLVSVGQHGVLTVANTGPVVAPELVAGLFEPFRRLAGERLDHGGGVGLGLTIVRSIAVAHGAAVDARANPDGGLVVEVRFRPVG
jgi:signal transduction histidine kinase